ncbi:hypothetical protein VTN31DRAFT_5851 [Thermomyces dupontii]|uniref:uncharacterized protein n=1 Tax=Talaromyces thermophilus TaxID=28565 RepID=UPI003744A00B
MAFAIASKFGLPIYMLNFGNITEERLIDLFGQLPRRCIVLLEDIDCIGISRKYEVSSTSAHGTMVDGFRNASRAERESQALSLSALLNAIDGVAAPEGHILIMTTNHPEHLDPALIRPGRVDMQVAFGYDKTKKIRESYSALFMEFPMISLAWPFPKSLRAAFLKARSQRQRFRATCYSTRRVLKTQSGM